MRSTRNYNIQSVPTCTQKVRDLQYNEDHPRGEATFKTTQNIQLAMKIFLNPGQSTQ